MNIQLTKKQIIGVLFLLSILLFATAMKPNSAPTIYLIPGQGADYRLFSKLTLTEEYPLKHIKYVTPERGITMHQYARLLATQIDTTQAFILIGTSFGGMIATEMNEFLQPVQTIIISSAKSRYELPKRYRFQQKFPLYKILSSRLSKLGSQVMQPIVEPDRNKEKEIFKSMLKAKDPDFLRNTIDMIINWDKKSYNPNIIHIHGNKDKTIPIRNVQFDYFIEGGSHMITLTRAEELSLLLNELLAKGSE